MEGWRSACPRCSHSASRRGSGAGCDDAVADGLQQPLCPRDLVGRRGRAEPGDPSAEFTALRETEEEIGLARAHIDVVGSLPVYTTVTNFVVTPVVALVEPGFALQPDPFEVAEVFEVPLAFLMTPAHHQRHAFEWQGGHREFLAMPWQPPDAEQPYFIWGATAAMLRNFYRFLSA